MAVKVPPPQSTPNNGKAATLDRGQPKSDLPVFLNTEAVVHSHALSFSCLWLLYATTVELSSFNRDRISPQATNIYYLGFYRSLLALALHY